MHEETYAYVTRFAKDWTNRAPNGDRADVLEIGSRNVNGEVRSMFDVDNYWGIDIREGDGVDQVVAAELYAPERRYDLVLCLEVFEHTPRWALILDRIATTFLNPGGTLVMTAACDPRERHSDTDGGQCAPFEYYENVDIKALSVLLQKLFDTWTMEVLSRGDVRVTAKTRAEEWGAAHGF